MIAGSIERKKMKMEINMVSDEKIIRTIFETDSDASFDLSIEWKYTHIYGIVFDLLI